MVKKMRKAVLCLVILLLINMVTVTAEEAFDSQWRIDVGSNSVNISGYTKSLPYSSYSIIVKEKGKTGLQNASYMIQDTVDEYGMFSHSILKGNLEVSKKYCVTIAPVNGPIINFDYYYASDAELADALAAINADSSAVLTNAQILNINLSSYNLFDEQKKQKVLENIGLTHYMKPEEVVDAFYNIVESSFKDITYEIYVSDLDGDDVSGDGSVGAPYKTITRARNVVRQLKYAGEIRSDITVYIGEGTYCEEDGLVFDEHDNLPSGYRTIYKAYDGEKAIISGSKSVEGWTEYEDGKYYTDVGTNKEIDVLYRNGRMLTKARYPNAGSDMLDGYLRSVGIGQQTNTCFGFKIGDFPEPAKTDDLEVLIWPGSADIMWYCHTIGVKTVDYNTQTITLKEPSTAYKINSGVGSGEEGNRYFLQGALEFMDEEGEFYYDSQIGRLYMIPPSGEQPGEITIPYLDAGITFKGSDSSTPVKGIEIDGLVIQNTARSANVARGEGFEETGNGIYIENAQDITIRNSIIHDVGGHGISITGSVNDCNIYGNEIYNVGHSGVSFNSDGRYQNTFTYSRLDPICTNNIVSNNYVHDGSLLTYHGYGIAYLHSGAKDNVVSHNKIEYFKRSGLRSEYVGYVNYMEYNDISNVNTGSEDTGIIYASSNARIVPDGVTITDEVIANAATSKEGCVIRNNRIHTSPIIYGGGAAVYIDDFAHGYVVENNLIEGVQDTASEHNGKLTTPFLIKADDVVLHNNYAINIPVADCSIIFNEQNGSTANGQVVENNIFFNTGTVAYTFPTWSDSKLKRSDNNIFYVSDGSGVTVYMKKYNLNFNLWKTLYGYDKNSLTGTNPLFVNSESGDWRLKYNSPAYGIGIQDLDMQSIGLLSDFKYTDTSDMPQQLFVRQGGESKNSSYIMLDMGETAELELLLRTEEGFVADNDNVIWTYSSNNQKVVDVSSSGKITALATGQSVVTVMAMLNGKSVETTIDVIVSNTRFEPITLSDITFTDTEGNVVEALNGTDIRVSGNITGNVFPQFEVTPIYAILDENESVLIRAVVGNKVILEKGQTKDLCLDITDAEGSIKIFMWDMDTLTPYAEALTFPNQE